ncbi:MAG: hypothetical protein SGPRY_004518 [Prymnesium sp.]
MNEAEGGSRPGLGEVTQPKKQQDGSTHKEVNWFEDVHKAAWPRCRKETLAALVRCSLRVMREGLLQGSQPRVIPKKHAHCSRKRVPESLDDTSEASRSSSANDELFYAQQASWEDENTANENEKTSQQGGQWSLSDSSEDEQVAADERPACPRDADDASGNLLTHLPALHLLQRPTNSIANCFNDSRRDLRL